MRSTIAPESGHEPSTSGLGSILRSNATWADEIFLRLSLLVAGTSLALMLL